MAIPDETMAISKFKATCLAVLERVRRTGQPVRITRFGTPVADIVPPAPKAERETWVGALRGHGRVAGDLIEPAVDAEEWDALSDEPRRKGAARKEATRKGRRNR